MKRTLQTCCQQLRTQLAKRNAQRDFKERQSRLLRYVPDVGRAVFGLLDAMMQRKQGTNQVTVNNKKIQALPANILSSTIKTDITEKSLQDGLVKAISTQHMTEEEEAAASSPALKAAIAQPVFIIPVFETPTFVLDHPAFTFRLFRPPDESVPVAPTCFLNEKLHKLTIPCVEPALFDSSQMQS